MSWRAGDDSTAVGGEPAPGQPQGARPVAKLGLDDTREWLAQIDAWELAVRGAVDVPESGVAEHVGGADAVPTGVPNGREPDGGQGSTGGHGGRLGALPEEVLPESVLFSVAQEAGLRFDGPLEPEPVASAPCFAVAQHAPGPGPDALAALCADLEEQLDQGRCPDYDVSRTINDISELISIIQVERETCERLRTEPLARARLAVELALLLHARWRAATRSDQPEAAAAEATLPVNDEIGVLASEAQRLVGQAAGGPPEVERMLAPVWRLGLALPRGAGPVELARAQAMARRLGGSRASEGGAYLALARELGELAGTSGADPVASRSGPQGSEADDPVALADEAGLAAARGRTEQAADLLARAGLAAHGRAGAALLAAGGLAHLLAEWVDHAEAEFARALELDAGSTRAVLGQVAALLRRSAPGPQPGDPAAPVGATSQPIGLSEALAVAARVPSSALAAALLCTLARSAERAGDEASAVALAQAVAGDRAPGVLPRPERLLLLPGRLAAASDGEAELEEFLAGALAPAERALIAAAAAETFMTLGRAELAVLAIRRGLESCPEATFVALMAERLADAVTDRGVQGAALRLWGTGDPARRRRAQYALALRAIEEGDQATFARCAKAALGPSFGELGASGASDPFGAALFLDLAWAALRQRDVGNARALLEEGARVLADAGEEGLAAALRERGEDARHIENPTVAVSRALSLSLSSWAADTLDHPRVLGTTLIERAATPEQIAARFRAAALGSRKLTLRVLEAASWLVVAGQPRQAVQLLQPRWGDPLTPSTAGFLARLATQLPAAGEPDACAVVLQRLIDATSDPAERAALGFRRAELLFAGGHGSEGAALLRELAAGPLVLEVDAAYRRLLWAAGDGAALDALARDEVDAQQGVGRFELAAQALLERAMVRATLLDDLRGALDLVLHALALAPEEPSLRIAHLVLAGAGADREGVREAVEWLARREQPDRGLRAAAAFVDLSIVDATRAAADQLPLLTAALPEEPADPPLALLERMAASSDDGLAQVVAVLARTPDRDRGLLVDRVSDLGWRALAAGRWGDAQEALERVGGDDVPSLPVATGLAVAALHLGDAPRAVRALRATAERARAAATRAQAHLLSGYLLREPLGDPDAAERSFRLALQADPDSGAAHGALAEALAARGAHAELADCLATRAAVATEPAELATLALRESAARLACGQRDTAKAVLRRLLAEQPAHAGALGQLGDLEFEDGAFAIAAELYLRLVKLEPEPEELKKTLRRLGRIYHRRLNDSKLAIAAYERVLRLEPTNLEALSALSSLYANQNDLPRAAATTSKAIALEPDANRRITLRVQLGNLHEKAGELGLAVAQLRQAVDEGPRSLQAIGELARFYERNQDPQARRVLLDGALGLLHEDLRNDAGRFDTLRTIVPLLRWRKRAAGSAAIAQVLAGLTDEARERQEIGKWAAPPARGRRLGPLGNPEIDELVMPPGRAAGLRQVMRLFGPVLARTLKPDLRAFGLARSRRVPSGRSPRTYFESLAVDLNQRGFDLYVAGDPPAVLAVEPGDPPALIVGERWVEAGPVALRFAAGTALRLAATHFDLLLAGGPEAGAALLSALVRAFVPGYDPHPAAPELVAAAQVRIEKLLTRALRAELSPFVAEVAAPTTPAALRALLVEVGARVGLLACGDLGVALQVLAESGLGAVDGRPPHRDAELPAGASLAPADLRGVVAHNLIDFALSSEFEMVVRALDSVS